MAEKKSTEKKKTTKKKSTTLRLTKKEQNLVRNYRKCSSAVKKLIEFAAEKGSSSELNIINLLQGFIKS